MKIIDVSYVQGKNIDWKKVKDDAVKGAILRIGYGRETNQKDSTFDINVKGCQEVGIPFLTYHYSYATDTAGAKKEAQCFLKWAEGKTFNRKLVFFDIEESKQYALSQSKIRALIDTYADELQKEGWEVGVYSYLYFLQKIGIDWLDKNYKVWIAQYSRVCSYSGNKVLWQYTSSGKVNGINTNVDVNECYDESLFKEYGEDILYDSSKLGTVVNTTYAGVRKEPFLNASVIITLKKGAEVEVFGENGGFYKVFNGYIFKTLIQFKDQSDTLKDTIYNNPKVGVIYNTSSAYVRKGPSTETDIITSLKKDTKVELLGENGDFYKVANGYISKLRVKIDTSTILKNPYPKSSKVETVSYKKYGNINLTDHFKLGEFKCSDGSDTIKFDWYTVNALEAARQFFGKSLNITSAYRTEAYNKKIGGATGSYHTKGRAVDCYISGQSPSLLAKFFEVYGMKGIGCYYDDRFVHVDSRLLKSFWKNQSCIKVSTHLPTIQIGSKGQDVMDAQILLNRAGASLAVDGSFGSGTFKAVQKFQKEHGLSTDGIIGKKSWKALLTK